MRLYLYTSRGKILFLMTLLLLSFHVPAQNYYLITAEKVSYSNDEYLYSNNEFFTQKLRFYKKEAVLPLGVYYKKLDLKKAKTDTSELKNVLLARPELSVGILNGKGKFMLPPVYTLFSTSTDYGLLLAQKMKTGLWKITIYSEASNKWFTLPQQPDFNCIGFNFLMFKATNGKYGLLTRYGRELLPAVYDSVQFLTKTLNVRKERGEYKSLEGCFRKGLVSIIPFADNAKEEVAYIRFKSHDTTVWVNTNFKIFRSEDEVIDDSGMRKLLQKAIDDSIAAVKLAQQQKQFYENEVRIQKEIETEKKRIRDLEANPANFTGKIAGSYKDIKLTVGGFEYIGKGSSYDEILGVHTKDFNIISVSIYFKCTTKFYGTDSYSFTLDADLTVKEGKLNGEGFGSGSQLTDGYIFPEASYKNSKGETKRLSLNGYYNPKTNEIVLTGVDKDGRQVIIRAKKDYLYKN